MEKVDFNNERPMFIPLSGHWFDSFICGEKSIEYRRLGTRWNAHTCKIGRSVILSRGYGKKHRAFGIIVGFSEVDASADPAIRSVYPDGELFAAISIKIQREQKSPQRED